MEVINDISLLRAKVKSIKKEFKSIGFVPTMGALHSGHISLVARSVKENDFTVVSIFVNPIQFGPNEDFERYPRVLESDLNLMREINPDIVFVPPVSEMLQGDICTFVDINKLGDNLCGARRPGHFRGVCTIVAKFFNIVTPDRAYFGKKDIQQFMILSKMASDLNMDVELIGCDIVRESDGLAMSSRNIYLSEVERKEALVLSKGLKIAFKLFNDGKVSSKEIIDAVTTEIGKSKLAVIDYISIVNSVIQPVDIVKKGDIIALAVFFGKTRLIDNYIFGDKLCF